MGRFGWHSGKVVAKGYELQPATTASGYPDYGLDVSGPAEVKLADVKLQNDVCIKTGAGAPTDGGSGTGVDVCGPGSLYIDITNANHYINGGTKASPAWKLVTRA